MNTELPPAWRSMSREDVRVRDRVSPARFCQDLLSSLPRSDQRRWGEVYVRGLASVPGRKSIRRISDHIVGWRADQCLQQFVNQSTWQWQPVRRSLARQIASIIRPRAWVAQEMAFPKNGSNSVGVAKQYAPSAGRMLNCQLALAICLIGDEGSCPVDWRLLLPRCWDDDQARRARAHVPEQERARSRWQYLLDAVDEMAVDWALNPLPLLVDARHELHVESLLSGLGQRGLPYAVQVGVNTLAPPLIGLVDGQLPTVGDLAAHAARQGGPSLNWRNGRDGPPTVSRFTTAHLRADPPRLGFDRSYRYRPQLLAEWLPGTGRPHALWLTNLNTAQVPELVGLVRLQKRAAGDLAQLGDDVGLQHFEGRSFRGWHHHVTMASLAHAYQLAETLAEHDDEGRLDAYA
jgi:hypothetical protein